MNPAGATAAPARSVRVVMPGGVDDPAAPSGGNRYDRRVCGELPHAGWPVHEHAVPGAWPDPAPEARAELARILAESADGSVVLLDGLVACAVPEVIVPEAGRLRLAVLVHLPLADETGLTPERAAELDAAERRTLHAVSAVIATSTWAATRLITHHNLPPTHVHVAPPGTDRAPLSRGSAGGGAGGAGAAAAADLATGAGAGADAAAAAAAAADLGTGAGAGADADAGAGRGAGLGPVLGRDAGTTLSPARKMAEGTPPGTHPNTTPPTDTAPNTNPCHGLTQSTDAGTAPGTPPDLGTDAGTTLSPARRTAGSTPPSTAPTADTAPSADPADPAPDEGPAAPLLLCVATVSPRKGQLRLVEALVEVAGFDWRCVFVGGLGQDPGYVAQVRERIHAAGLGARIRLAGPRVGPALAATYAQADLLVLASHAETYGMAVTEALARGIPVLATAVGGVPEALGHAPDGTLPGALVPPDDPAALTTALRAWLAEPGERRRSKEAAYQRRTTLAGWDTTARSLAEVLEQLPHEPRRTA
ncbi:glycosyltransferase [Streptomyces sp. NPDC088261]|uniref:glycosyltransferase n=1 Tax=Streptomyces sp. NPDC088261 TaxID=3365851 RepID=UPI0037FC0B7B